MRAVAPTGRGARRADRSPAVAVAAPRTARSSARSGGSPLRAPGADPEITLETSDGQVLDLGAERWRLPADAGERSLLEPLPAPVLDVGCGPGRIVAALAGQGRATLGVDPSPVAVGEAERHRAPVLRRSVFDPLPGEGRWGAVVLFDGNVGIGGDPGALLDRCRALLRPGGRLLVELEPPGAPSGRLTVRLAVGGDRSPWFPWARVAADEAPGLVAGAGLALVRTMRHRERWFAEAER
jgi:SAM-dependent methyltransferase